MSWKKYKFYVINFIDSRIICFLKKLTPRAMKTHIQISYKEIKSKGRSYVQGLQMYSNSSLNGAQVH